MNGTKRVLSVKQLQTNVGIHDLGVARQVRLSSLAAEQHGKQGLPATVTSPAAVREGSTTQLIALRGLQEACLSQEDRFDAVHDSRGLNVSARHPTSGRSLKNAMERTRSWGCRDAAR
jgi:hypothetical protein